MGKLESNVFANMSGTAWSAALGVLCVPLYIKLMGAEAFGLVGIFITLQSIFVVLDLGISATLCREVARLAADGGGDAAAEQRDLVFTLQAVYWLIALAVGAAVFLLAPFIARHWLRPQSFSVGEVTTCIKMMGAAMALQFPFAFYQGGLLGLQRQWLLNAVSASMATLRSLGTLLALSLVSPTPELFFGWQMAAGAAGTAAVAAALWRGLPAAGVGRTRFRPELLGRVWRFSAAYAANSVANLGLFQGGKIILSSLLSLEMFGYYALAQAIAGGFYAVIIAVDGAIYPQFSGLVARGDEAGLARAYHRGAQVMSVLLMPAAITAAIFSREALTMWTGDPAIVENAHLILKLLVCGMLLYGLTQPLYYLQVAHGRWRLISAINLVLLLGMIPMYVLIARSYGGPGAASVWLLLNVCYMFTLPLLHRRFMRGQQWRWLFEDVCLPLAGVLAVGATGYWLLPAGLTRVEILAYLGAVVLSAAAAAAALAPQIRGALLAQLRRRPSETSVA
jgi:O-antigen/teichoic acid export membrane protein